MIVKFKQNTRRKLFIEFIKESHSFQTRKYTGEPYWHHPISVANILSSYLKHDSLLVEISLGHDLFEDVDITEPVLSNFLFNIGYSLTEIEYIILGISALTDVYTSKNFPKTDRRARKTLEIERLKYIDSNFQTIKYCDMIDNISNFSVMLKYDSKFAGIYLNEIEQKYYNLNDGNYKVKHYLGKLIKCCHHQIEYGRAWKIYKFLDYVKLKLSFM